MKSQCYHISCSTLAVYLCKCGNSLTYSCKAHYGDHCLSGGPHNPELLINTLSNSEYSESLQKLQNSINYLTEVQMCLLHTAQGVIKSIKKEVASISIKKYNSNKRNIEK